MGPIAFPRGDPAPGFFARLPPLDSPYRTFDAAVYRAAPDDWLLALTDIVGSTEAIAAGRHKTVNFVAAMAIAGARNLCAPEPIPILFGGDGAVLMAPARQQTALRQMLARVRGVAWREHGLRLRVGMVPVSALRSQGCDVLVARYEPTPGNSFGVFAGGGISVLEDAIRGCAWPAPPAAQLKGGRNRAHWRHELRMRLPASRAVAVSVRRADKVVFLVEAVDLDQSGAGPESHNG